MSIRSSVIAVALLAAAPAFAEGVIGGGGAVRSGGGGTPLVITPTPLVPALTTVAAGGSYVSTCATMGASNRIDFGATSSQAVTLKINRYLNTTCTIPLSGNPVQGAAGVATATSIAATDGAPAQSYTVEIDNTSGSTATITNSILLVSTGGAITGSPTYSDASGNQVQPVMPICNVAPCSQANPAFTVFAAGELHVGEFGNNQTTVTNVLTIGTTYAAAQAVGGLQTLAGAARVSATAGLSGTSGNVLSTVLMFNAAIGTVAFDVFYFNASPTASTCTDAVAFALAAADRDKVVAVAHVTDWTPGNAVSTGQALGPPIPYTLNNATSLFACVVARAAPPALTAGANASLSARVLRQ